MRDPKLIEKFNYEKIQIDTLLLKINELIDDFLKKMKIISILEDIHPSSEENYFNIFDKLIFETTLMNTQDIYLLTGVIINQAGYFVSLDTSLLKYKNKIRIEGSNVKLISPSEIFFSNLISIKNRSNT